AHGLAGIRLGYGCGDPELFQYFGRVRNSISVSVIAQAAGLAAIRDEGHIRRTVENNAEGAKWLFPQFAELGKLWEQPFRAFSVVFHCAPNMAFIADRGQTSRLRNHRNRNGIPHAAKILEQLRITASVTKTDAC